MEEVSGENDLGPILDTEFEDSEGQADKNVP